MGAASSIRSVFKKNLELVERLKEIAKAKSATPAQIALAWVLSSGDDDVPIIPGTKRRTRLEENAAAVTIELSPEERARLDAVFRPGVEAGARYGPVAAARINR